MKEKEIDRLPDEKTLKEIREVISGTSPLIGADYKPQWTRFDGGKIDLKKIVSNN
jgi:hypothetical protein